MKRHSRMARRCRRHPRQRSVAGRAVDRSRTENLLREREQRLQIATEAANMGMWDMLVGDVEHAPLPMEICRRYLTRCVLLHGQNK